MRSTLLKKLECHITSNFEHKIIENLLTACLILKNHQYRTTLYRLSPTIETGLHINFRL